jgi:signal peptidase
MTIIGSALFMWNIGKLVTNTESPIVVVMTGSMEPAFFRGDLLLVTHWKEELNVGDIVVFKVPNQSIPIVHRAVIVQVEENEVKEKIYQLSSNELFNDLVRNPFKEEFSALTKGDNNQSDDRGLYPNNVLWLNRK